ncbi:MAG: hypothetical protein AAF495_05020 [Pseudomonadota bacterium]
MSDQGKSESEVPEPRKQADARRKGALWLGNADSAMDMGFGRGPRTLEGYELVSWFFSRDGI